MLADAKPQTIHAPQALAEESFFAVTVHEELAPDPQTSHCAAACCQSEACVAPAKLQRRQHSCSGHVDQLTLPCCALLLLCGGL